MSLQHSPILYSPTSSTPSSSMELSLISPKCKVCLLPAHGNHFGAISCRACAAFFRRAITGAKTVYKCKKEDRCEIWKDGRYLCKKCRLVRCRQVGMDPGRFQFDRDLISATEQFTAHSKSKQHILFDERLPESVEHFLGHPHLIMFFGRQTFTEKNFVDCRHLVEKAARLLELGAEKPLRARNNLQKLALGLNMIRENVTSKEEVQLVKRMGKTEAFSLLEKDFLSVAKWLTYFDDFQQLPHVQQMFLLKSVWHVWSRLDKAYITARSRQHSVCENQHVMLWYDSTCDPKTLDMDVSWFSKYPKEQLAFFFDEFEEWFMVDVVEQVINLQPSDVELAYMLCQLCFHYAGKRFQGETLEMMEKFQDGLANNLHDYYVNELRMPRYVGRLNQMLKINNIIQQDIWEKRAKKELAKIFDVFCVTFSHPEMFEECIE